MLSRISKTSRPRGTDGLLRFASVAASVPRWQFLYFLPLPHQQGAFLPCFFFGIAFP